MLQIFLTSVLKLFQRNKKNPKNVFYKVNFNLSINLWLLFFPLTRHGKGLITVLLLKELLLFVIPISRLSRALTQNAAPQLCEAPVSNSPLSMKLHMALSPCILNAPLSLPFPLSPSLPWILKENNWQKELTVLSLTQQSDCAIRAFLPTKVCSSLTLSPPNAFEFWHLISMWSH